MKKIKIGVDFDGVVAYNPFRILRAPVTFFKRKILKKAGTKFVVPHTPWQRWLWTLMHESSVFPANGLALLKQMALDPKYEIHLISARYSFLRGDLDRWLANHELAHSFASIVSNLGDEQPHVFKERVVTELDLDYFIEDNLDIVAHLRKHTRAKIFWVYNALDKLLHPNDQYGFPYLKAALHEISF